MGVPMQAQESVNANGRQMSFLNGQQQGGNVEHSQGHPKTWEQISEHVQEKIADLRNRLGAQEIRERVLGKISKLQNWPRTPEIRERVQGKIADLRKSLGAQASSLRAHFDSIVDRFSGFAPAAQTSSISDVRQELATLESWLMSVEAEVYSLKEQFDSVIEKLVDASAEREDAVESVTSEFVDASDMMESVKDEE